MAIYGRFTYRDLYGGKPEGYFYENNIRFSSSETTQPLSILNTTITSFPTTTSFLKLISSTTEKSSNKFYKFIQVVPFAYFHWFLIGLAILLTLLLTIIFTCYCRNHCRKNKKSHNEKKQPLPNFYRYRTANRRVHAYNIYEPTAPLCFSSPLRSSPLKATEGLNNQLLRQGLDAVGSPQVPRKNISLTEPPSTFSNTASELLTEIKSRLTTRPSESLPKTDRSYETQRANMALNDESKQGSLLIDIN